MRNLQLGVKSLRAILGLLLPFTVLAQGGMMPGPGRGANSVCSFCSNVTAAWKLDESSGNATDSAGSTTLTNNNTVTYSTGKINNAGYFAAASTQYLSAASSAPTQMGDIDFTITAWVYLTATGGFHALVAKRGDTAGHDEYVIYYLTDRFNFAVFTATDTAVAVTANNFGAPSVGTWYFITAIHNAAANTVTISVNNGTADSQSTGGALQAVSAGQFSIGRQGETAGFGYHDGRVDNVTLIKQTISGTQQTCLYNGGTGLQWPFTGC